MEPFRYAARAAAIAVMFSVAACSGGGADVQSNVTTQTVGQELIDLQKARDAGALTPEEYERQRRAILDRNR